jgi:exodeoxyribonuclease III
MLCCKWPSNGPILHSYWGDFNTGQHPIDGDLQSISSVAGFSALRTAGFVDAWRHFNGNKQEFTYFRSGKGYRIDHALTSNSALAQLAGCTYLHELREQRLSDHSALIVEIHTGSHFRTL